MSYNNRSHAGCGSLPSAGRALHGDAAMGAEHMYIYIYMCPMYTYIYIYICVYIYIYIYLCRSKHRQPAR